MNQPTCTSKQYLKKKKWFYMLHVEYFQLDQKWRTSLYTQKPVLQYSDRFLWVKNKPNALPIYRLFFLGPTSFPLYICVEWCPKISGSFFRWLWRKVRVQLFGRIKLHLMSVRDALQKWWNELFFNSFLCYSPLVMFQVDQ